ncbi:peptidylprolyl isomerase [Chlorobaculum tepidum]|nr:peptidylprolyl isomerase [Chlorobaculum tepidum]
MSKLRDKTHIVLFVLVAAFLALIVFEWGMNFTGPTRKAGVAGKVNGESISMNEYEALYNNIVAGFRQSNPGVEITSGLDAKFREQAWNYVVDQTLLAQLLKKYGITVTDQEVLDAVNNPVNPPAIIRQNFTDPRTGKIDRQLLEQARSDPKAKDFWLNAQEAIKRELMVNKLVMTLRTMVFVTDPELTEVVQRQFTTFAGSFIPFPYSYAGAETNFPVKDDEIKAWYDSHKEQFREEPVRSAEFVFFPLTPSRQDSLQVKKEIDGLIPQFAAAKSDSEFVKIQSDLPNSANVTLSRADFSPAAGQALFSSPKLVPGQIVGPIADEGYYRLLKIKSVTTGEPVASASHILIRLNPADKAEAARAMGLLKKISEELKGGASFASLAAKYSEDPGSARNGGFVGWFTKDRMVPQFAQAVFAGKPGQIVGPVQTQFGLHIIKIEGFDNRRIVCSEVARQIKASTQTSETIKRQAQAFLTEAKSKGFEAAAKAQRLEVGKTGDFTRQSLLAVPGMGEAITGFAFKAKDSDISDVLDAEKGFVVAKLLTQNDTGYHQLDAQLKEMIKTELVREKQGAALKSKLVALSKSSGGSLDAIAAKDPSLRKITSKEIRWRDGYIDGYGVDPQLVEGMAGMKLNTLSQPVQTSGGYALVQLTSRQLAPGTDLAAEKQKVLPQLMQARQQQFLSEYLQSYRRNAKIEDFR